MKLYYRMRMDIVGDECGDKHKVYGVEAVAENGEIVASATDVFTDKDRAEELIERINRLELSIYHLMDIIDDALAE